MNGTDDCLGKDYICDGEWDCDDGKDEQKEEHPNNPTCKTLPTSCGIEQFRCQDGQCIDEKLHCDGKRNCKDASDEMDGDCGM